MRCKLSLATLTMAVAFAVPGVAHAQTPGLPCVDTGVGVAVGTCPKPGPAPTPIPTPSGECQHTTDIPTPATLGDARAATLCLLNKERAQRGLGKLAESPALEGAAVAFSRSMVTRDFFDHVSPGGSTIVDRIKRTSYLKSASSWAIGENIAWGSGSLSTPAKTVDAWMHSAGHKRNILTPRFEHIGVGIAPGAPVRLPAGQPAATYTTDFGAR